MQAQPDSKVEQWRAKAESGHTLPSLSSGSDKTINSITNSIAQVSTSTRSLADCVCLSCRLALPYLFMRGTDLYFFELPRTTLCKIEGNRNLMYCLGLCR